MKIKFQQGGAFTPPFAVYQPFIVPQAEETSSRRSSKKSSDEDSSGMKMKDIYGLLGDIGEALPGDIEAVSSQLVTLFNNIERKLDSPTSSLFGGTSSIASEYIKILKLANNIKYQYQQYKDAKKIAEDKGSLGEVVINSTGQIMVTDGEGFDWISPEEYFENKENYSPITNAQLLDFRQKGVGGLALNASSLHAVSGSIGMKDVTDLITNALSSLGKDTQSYQSTQMADGVNALVRAQQLSGLSSLDDLYNADILTSTQANQAQQALTYIYNQLPTPAKTLLKIHSDGTESGVINLISQLVKSKTSTTIKIDDSFKKSANSSGKTTGSPESVLDKFELDPANLLLAGYGNKDKFIFQTAEGKTTGLSTDAISLPLVTKEGASLGSNITLNEVTKSAFAGALNTGQVSMGGVMLDYSGFNKVVTDGTLYVSYLPIDLVEFSNTGNIKPDIDMLKRFENAKKEVKQGNITDKQKINEIYKKHNLPLIFTENGNITTNYRRFGMLNAHALDSAFNENVDFEDWLFETFDNNEIDNVMSIINTGPGASDFDKKSGWDSFSPIFNDHSHMYRGTVFISINDDAFANMIAAGNNPTSLEAEVIEARQQHKDKANALNLIYNNPGNQL